MASTPYLIPLQPEPQQFIITLAGITYTLRVTWNAPNASWILDLMDAAENDILTGVPLITGADLLEQYGYLGIGGSLVVQSSQDPDLVPDFASLGSTGNLYFLVVA